MRLTTLLTIGIAALSLAPSSHSQVAASALKLFASDYLYSGSVPPNAQIYLQAIGTRLSVPGSERMTLTGSSTGSTGTGSAVLIWQLPGSVSLTRAAGATLIFTPSGGVSSAAALSQTDQDVLEDLSSGTHEAFLYSFTQRIGHRLLGTHVRADDGQTKNYTGPYYDVFETVGPVAAANSVTRQKWFFFDGTTGLLAKVRYLLNRNGAVLAVEDQFSGWTTQNGQLYPGQIVRTENGAAVFTFKTAAAVFGPALSDAVFAGH